MRSVRHLLDVDPGFRPDGAIAFRVAPPQVSPTAGSPRKPSSRTPRGSRPRAAFYTEMLERLREAPGVSSVAREPPAAHRRLVGDGLRGRRPRPRRSRDKRTAFGRVVTPGYFGAMGMRLRAGRSSPRPTPLERNRSWSWTRSSLGASSASAVPSARAAHRRPDPRDDRGRRLRHAHGRSRPTRFAHLLRAARPVGVRLLPRLGHGRRRAHDGRSWRARAAAASSAPRAGPHPAQLRRAHARRARRPRPWAAPRELCACSAASRSSRCCWPRSGSTACWPSSRASEPASSACGWRSARARRRSALSCSLRD